jgi:hypothetical protein
MSRRGPSDRRGIRALGASSTAFALTLAWEFGLKLLASAGEATAAKTAIEPTKIDCAIRMGKSSVNGLKSLPSNKNNLAIFGQRAQLSLLAQSFA